MNVINKLSITTILLLLLIHTFIPDTLIYASNIGFSSHNYTYMDRKVTPVQ